MKPEYLSVLIARFRRALRDDVRDLTRDEYETLTRDYADALFEAAVNRYSTTYNGHFVAGDLLSQQEYTESVLRLQKEKDKEAAQ